MFEEDKFTHYLEDTRHPSPVSVSAYLSDIRAFESFISGAGKSLTDAISSDIKDYIEKLRKEQRSNSTLNRKMVSLRVYYEFLQEFGRISESPVKHVKVPKDKPKDIDYLSVEEISKLFELPGTDAKGLRDRALLELSYACGLKVTELCNVNCSDVDLRIGFISVRSESGKARVIPMGKPARTAIIAYLGSSREQLLSGKEDSGALFLNYTGSRITRQGVWKIIKFYGEKAGLKKELNPQLLRNSFAAHLILNGADLKSVQELMGNEDMAVVRLFFSLSKNRLMDVYDRAFPRA